METKTSSPVQRWAGLILGGGMLLSLNGCFTLSPLSAGDTVTVTGQIVSESGDPLPDLKVSLDLPWLSADDSSRTDASGQYQFELNGSQTITGIAAADLNVSASNEAGAQVSQDFKALKTAVVLPTMRFWNGLSAPTEGAALAAANTFQLSWQASQPAARSYQVAVEGPQGTVWKAQSDSTTYALPTAALEAGQDYSWSATAQFSDYEAQTAARHFSAASLPLKARQIQSVKDGKGSRPAWFDGDFRDRPQDNEIDFENSDPISLTLQLTAKQSVSALHWVGSGFSARLEVRATPSGPLLTAQDLQDYQILTWPAVQTQQLYLTLKPELSGGFVRLRELRVLGPN